MPKVISEKRHFTVVIGKKEHGLYISSSPSSAAKKAVSKLCATDKKKKVEFSIREITQKSKKKIYGPYLGYIEKLKESIQLKGRLIEYNPVAKLIKKKVVKKGGKGSKGSKYIEMTNLSGVHTCKNFKKYHSNSNEFSEMELEYMNQYCTSILSNYDNKNISNVTGYHNNNNGPTNWKKITIPLLDKAMIDDGITKDRINQLKAIVKSHCYENNFEKN